MKDSNARYLRLLIGAVLLAVGALASSCAGTSNSTNANSMAQFPPMKSGTAPGASPEAIALSKALGRGVNFGNMLEAPKVGTWGVGLDDEYFDKVVQGGFNSVRLPVRWSNHAAVTADAALDEEFAKIVDHHVDELLKRNVVVVLNMHHYRQLDGDKLDVGEAPVELSVVRLRFLNLWKQIALRYRDRPAGLIFELYNEPHGAVESAWNDLASRALRAIRESDPTRVVMIGSTAFNNANALRGLVLPNDPHLIVTFHSYEPFHFTHQSTSWVAGSYDWVGTPCCSAAQQAEIRAPLDTAVAWSKRNRYPVFLGEFGANFAADMPSREIYTRYTRMEAEKRGLSWSYWNFSAHNFQVYIPSNQTWVEPIKNALTGP